MSGPHVLIVEDSADQLLLLRKYFERAGCTVDTADSAESALSLQSDPHPTIAVLDLLLPGMDGTKLALEIRDRYPECAIVITSVLDPESYPAADAVLPKPVTGRDVRRVIAEFASERNAS